MKTLAKVLLFVFWLLGAGTGWPTPDAAPAKETTTYNMALLEGVDLMVQGHRVTVHVEHRWGSRRLALSAAVPGWVAALSAHLHASAAPAVPATAAGSEPPSPTQAAPRGS